MIIHQTLYDLFPPASIDLNLISPLTVNEFIQRILVPEVGVRLIMEDQGLQGKDGMETAVCILRESANYGVAMFPEDGGEWGLGGGESGNGQRGRRGEADEEVGVADRIVMERARRRRKELEQEEAEAERRMEMETGELEVMSDVETVDGKQTKPILRWRKGPDPSEKAKGKTREVDPPLVVVSRPKPRRLGKTSSNTSVLTGGKYSDITPSGSQMFCEEETNIDGPGARIMAQLGPRPKRKPSERYSPTVTDTEQQTDTESAPRKMTKLTRVISSGSTVLNLCSSSDDDAKSIDGTTRGMERRTRRKRAVLATNRPAPGSVPEAEDSGTDPVIADMPVAKRIQRPVEYEDPLEETPRPLGRSYLPPATESQFLPLLAAQKRRGARSQTASE